MRTLAAPLALAAMTLAGCAKNASEIPATFVSQSKYNAMSCERLDEEMNRVAAEVARVSSDQDDAATRDAIVTGVGIVLFWPALFILAAGDSDVELGELKGKYEAIDGARVHNRCDAAAG